MYTTILLLHIVAAMAWVGGGILLQGSLLSAMKSGGVRAADEVLQKMEWAEKVFFPPASLLTLALGITLVAMSPAWHFSQFWVYGALVLWVGSLVTAAAIGGGKLKRLSALRSEGLVESREYATVVRSHLRTGSLDVAVVLIIVFLMVFKPGI